MTNLRFAAELAERLKSTGPFDQGAPMRPASLLGEGGTLEQLTGTSLRSGSTLARAAAEGRISLFSALGYIFSRAIAQGTNLRTDAIIREMIFDPDLAAVLSKEFPKGGNMMTPQDMRKINRLLFTNGINYSVNDMMFGQQPDPDVVEMPTTQSVESPLPRPRTDNVPLRFQGLPPPTPPATNPQAFVAPPVAPPVMAPTPPASAPNAPVQPTASELFPNDPTLAAIERRRPAQGIASLA